MCWRAAARLCRHVTASVCRHARATLDRYTTARCIGAFFIFELFVATTLGLSFYFVPLAKLAWPVRTRGLYVRLAQLKGYHTLLGIVGVTCRKRNAVKYYQLNVWISVLVFLMFIGPLLKLRCTCSNSNYWQCDAMAFFGPNIVNLYTRPPKTFEDQKAWPAGERALLVLPPDDNIGLQITSSDDLISKCECDSQCKQYYKVEDNWDGMVPTANPLFLEQIGWCTLRPKKQRTPMIPNATRLDACGGVAPASDVIEDGEIADVLWTQELCRQAGERDSCTCHRHARCEAEGGKRWCPVEFDSACPDLDTIDNRSRHSARLTHMSAVACLNHEVTEQRTYVARTRCMIVRIAFVVIVAFSGVGVGPISYMLCLFMRNGCASSVQLDLPTQFEVALSSSTRSSYGDNGIDSREVESGSCAMSGPPNSKFDRVQSRSTISSWDSVPLESEEASDSKTVTLELGNMTFR